MNDKDPLHVFVMGLDDVHLKDLQTIDDVDHYRFHSLLDKDEVVFLDDYNIADLLDRAQQQIDAADHPVHGILGHWDFPVTSLVPILAKRNNLPGPSLKSVCKCTHKYWSRLEQSRIIPECTPRFELFDPMDDRAVDSLELPYPFWIKPIKGYGSKLGFCIENREQLQEAVEVTREEIKKIGDAFSQVLDLMPISDDIKQIGGDHCLAEEIVSGRELAPEGSSFQGKVNIHGLIDMPRHRGSFLRYGYPAQVEKDLEQRIYETTERLIKGIDYDNACFNVEYFFDESKDKLWVVEINPRISQSHCYQFEMVNGVSNHQVAVQVATGQQPDFEPRQGPYGAAAKCMYRSWEDGRVTHVPDQARMAEIKEQFPDCKIVLKVEEGTVLSEASEQDSYSAVLAHIYVCGKDEQDMMHRFDEIVEALGIQIDPLTASKS